MIRSGRVRQLGLLGSRQLRITETLKINNEEINENIRNYEQDKINQQIEINKLKLITE